MDKWTMSIYNRGKVYSDEHTKIAYGKWIGISMVKKKNYKKAKTTVKRQKPTLRERLASSATKVCIL